jgi:hypothetical protein
MVNAWFLMQVCKIRIFHNSEDWLMCLIIENEVYIKRQIGG